jgi:triacylglycerol lipase
MRVNGVIAGALARFDPEPVVVDPGLMPVVLVHGIFCTTVSMERMAKALRAVGRETHVIALQPADGSARIEELAAQLGAFVQEKLGARSFHLVGFSMGGLVSRYYLQEMEGCQRARSYLTLSTPHHGTWLAYLNSGLGGKQMRPGSAFLQRLNAGAEKLQAMPFLSLWTCTDLIILPATSSVISGLPSEHFLAWSHAGWIFEMRCVQRVVQQLAAWDQELS